MAGKYSDCAKIISAERIQGESVSNPAGQTGNLFVYEKWKDQLQKKQRGKKQLTANLKAENKILTKLYHCGFAATFSWGSLIFRSNKFPFPRQCAQLDAWTFLHFTSGSRAAAGSAGRTKVTTSLPLPLHKIICDTEHRDQSLPVT